MVDAQRVACVPGRTLYFNLLRATENLAVKHAYLWRMSWVVLWLGAVLSLAVAPAAAGTGTRVTLPAGPKIKNGLRVNIDTTWVDSSGYRPVQLEFISWPPGPAPADRTIRVEFKPSTWRGGYAWCGVTKFIEIPQGATSVQASISVPQREQWNTFQFEFYEDGRKLEDLSYQGGMVTVGNYGWTEASPAMLFIDSDAPPRALRAARLSELQIAGEKNATFTLPDVRGLAEVRPPPDLMQLGYSPDTPANDLSLMTSLTRLWSRIEILPPSDLSTRWIDYTGIDLVFISRKDLQQCMKQNPEQWQAVRDLISTGPTLCVYDAGDEFQHLEALEKLLQLPPLAPDPAAARNRGWTSPSADLFKRELIGAEQPYNNQYWYAQQQAQLAQAASAAAMQPAGEAKPQPSKPVENIKFVWRPANMGRVVAIANENPFPGRPQDWSAVLNAVNAGNWMWYRRHGVSLNRRNLDYWNFLIPGVGLAPVNSFLVLISLFVVVIGPINYLLLVRQGRLYLLLITVPLGAILVTLGLVGYALVTDGVGVKGRLRSFTEIDQRRGRSVSWSRQSYYAAMTPSHGLQFPETAAVYPLEVEPNRQPNYYRNRYRIDWEDGQTLADGYITSRVTSQMTVVQARETSARVEISEGRSGAPQATNRLGVKVDYFVMRDARGDFYAATNFSEGRTATLEPVAWKDAAKTLRTALAAVRPYNPAGYDPREHNDALDFGRSTYYWWGGDVDSGMAEPTAATSLLERALRRVSSDDPDALAPRSYAALAPHSPEVPLGVEQIKPMRSVHVITGQW
jgi:hypothetical protein